MEAKRTHVNAILNNTTEEFIICKAQMTVGHPLYGADGLQEAIRWVLFDGRAAQSRHLNRLRSFHIGILGSTSLLQGAPTCVTTTLVHNEVTTTARQVRKCMRISYVHVK